MRRISWLIRTFSVSMLVVAAVQSLATRRTGTLSEEELRQILGADHLKASVGVSRNCDQVNRDLVNQ